MKDAQYLLCPVGIVHSSLKVFEGCPKQGWEGAPDAWLEIYTAFADALDGIAVGNDILILTWLHKGRRDLLKDHPPGNPSEPFRGVSVIPESDER